MKLFCYEDDPKVHVNYQISLSGSGCPAFYEKIFFIILFSLAWNVSPMYTRIHSPFFKRAEVTLRNTCPTFNNTLQHIT